MCVLNTHMDPMILKQSIMYAWLLYNLLFYVLFQDFVDQVGTKYYVGVSAFVKVQLKVRSWR